MMKVAPLTERPLPKALPSTTDLAIPSPRMAVSTPTQKSPTEGSKQLSRQQVDALLGRLRDPNLARKFLMDAGLIDSDGQLTPPYRNQDAQTA